MQDKSLPLFRTFFTSSIRQETAETRLVFLGLMALADAQGVVQATTGAIADFVSLNEIDVKAALTRLSSPDENSTSPDEEGRRIVSIGPNRWRIVNYQTYAARAFEIQSAEIAARAENETVEKRRQQAREASKTYRQKKAKRHAPSSDVIKNLMTRHQESDDVISRQMTSSKAHDAPQPTENAPVAEKGQNLAISLDLGSSNLEPKPSTTTKSKSKGLDTGAGARTRSYTAEDPEMRLARFLFAHRRKNDSLAKEPNFDTWAKEFDGLLNREHRELDDLKAAIQFSQRDPYWLKRIISAKLFRRHFEMMWMQMGGKSESTGGKSRRFAEYDD